MKLPAFIALLVAGWYSGHAQQNISIKVTAGKHDVERLPVRVIFEKPLPKAAGYQLVQSKTGRRIPAQQVDSQTLVFIPDQPIVAGTNATYSLIRTSSALKSNIKIEKQQQGLLVKVSDKPLFFYHVKEALPPPDSPSYYKRSGFIHPLYSPDGQILTDDFPVGHVHQHGIFMTWVNTRFRNSFVDFWNQFLQKGTVEHLEVVSILQGPVFAELKLLLRHTSRDYGEVLQDTWTLTVFPFSTYFLFDLQSDQRNTSSDTLFLNRYHYGGLAWRGSRHWNPEDHAHFQAPWNVRTSEGLQDSTANQTHARWVDASGLIDGKRAGLTVFGYPSNFRYPQPIRVHPAMPYWCFAPVIDGEFYLAPGAVYRSGYRYLSYVGDAPTELVDMIEAGLTEPPTIRVNYR